MRGVGGHHGDRVSAVESLYRCLYGLEQVAIGPEVMFDQMSNHLGVGIRIEAITQANQFRSQGLVILDDAVVHHRYPLA